LESRGEWRAAAAAYADALRMCDSVAEIHYRMAVCYRRLQEPAKAWDEFQRALDEDGMPIRATSVINDAVRSVGDGGLVTTVDAVRRLRERSADGLIGFDLMIDAHHPNLKGYVLISQLIADEIDGRFSAGVKTVRTIDEPAVATRFGIGKVKNFEIEVSRGRWFTRVATWRYDPRDRLSQAENHFRRALEIDPARYESHLGLAMVQFVRGDAAGGENRLAAARKMNPEAVDRYLQGTWVRRVRDRARRAEPGQNAALGPWR
jgi:tetratricopeptide (TPR) repeat protein